MKLLPFVCLFLIELSSHAEVYQLFEENGKKGIKNEQGQVIIPPSFEALGWSDGSFSVIGDVTGYRLNHQWGLINLKREFITKADFENLVYAGGDCLMARKQINPAQTKSGCLNLRGEIKIPFSYDGIQVQGLRAVVFNLVGAKFYYGLADLHNKMLVPMTYRNIYPLGTLRFAVQNQQGKIALYDEDGKAITDFTIDSVSNFYKGYAIVYENLLQGLIDREGQIKLETTYQSIKITQDGKILTRLPNEWVWLNNKNETLRNYFADHLSPLSEGFSLVTSGGKVGVIDSELKILIPIQYDRLQEISPKRFIARIGNKEGVINMENQVLIDFIYDSLQAEHNWFKAFTKMVGWQLLDREGKVLSKKYYTSFGESNEAGFLVQHRNYWGLMDRQGEEIVHCVFDSITEVKTGMLAVKFRGQYGIMDVNENWKLAPQEYPIKLVNETHYLLFQPANAFLKNFDGVTIYFTPYKAEFKKDFWIEFLPDGTEKEISYQGTILKRTLLNPEENVQHVFKESEGLRGVEKDSKFGFVDSNGKLRIANRYDSIGEFHEGLAPIKLIGKWGYINPLDKIAINPNYQAVSSFFGGFAIAKQNSKVGLINKSGSVVLSFRYDKVIRLPNQKFEIISSLLKGRVNRDGRVEVEPRFDFLEDGVSGLLISGRDGKYGLITEDGLGIIPLIYDKLSFNLVNTQFLGLKKSEWKEIILQ